MTDRRDQWCPVHGRDPDEERDKRLERRWDRERWARKNP